MRPARARHMLLELSPRSRHTKTLCDWVELLAITEAPSMQLPSDLHSVPCRTSSASRRLGAPQPALISAHSPDGNRHRRISKEESATRCGNFLPKIFLTDGAEF